MKRLILSCCFALLAIGLAIFQGLFINTVCDDLLTKLDNNYTVTELKKYTEDWENKTHILNLFISHSHGDEIEKNLKEMIDMAEDNNLKQLKYIETNTKEQLQILKESEYLIIDNIL